MTHRRLALVFAIALGGCFVIDSGGDPPKCTGGKCDGGGVDQTCKDPHYGDGTCDAQLSCSVPDIDCFRTFDTDAEASTWWSTEQKKVGQDFPVVTESDPHFAKVRDALDKGWAAFKVHRPVGKLADKRPALVIVDKPIENAAFVYTDQTSNNQPFAVMVETGALALDVSDEQLLGVMMHELQHAVGLHRIGNNLDRIKKFYTAPRGTEPLGRDEVDDPEIRKAGLAWTAAAGDIGSYSQAELGGLPLSGDFLQIFNAVLGSAMQNHPDICTDSIQAISQIGDAVDGAKDLTDGSLLGDLSDLTTVIPNTLSALRDDCLGNLTTDFIGVAAAVAMTPPAEFEAHMDPHDVALVKGIHFVDGLWAIVSDRRETMRSVEDMYATASGEAWTQLRYFSVEEDADDVSQIVMRGAKQDPAAMAGFLHAVMPKPAAAACDTKLAGNILPGYGVDLSDEHHALCWRIAHQQREAAAPRTLVHPAGPITVRMPQRLPLPRSPYVITN